MIILVIFTILLILISAVPKVDNSYHEYCRLECWSLRNPHLKANCACLSKQ